MPLGMYLWLALVKAHIACPGNLRQLVLLEQPRSVFNAAEASSGSLIQGKPVGVQPGILLGGWQLSMERPRGSL